MADVRGELRDQRSPMSTLDAIALGAAALGLAAAWAIQLFMAPYFFGMFVDFGSDSASLPALTRMIARPVAISIVSVAVLVLAGGGLALRLTGQRGVGGAALGVGVALSWLTVPVMLYALYAPMTQLSSSIAP